MAPQREWFEKDYYKTLGVPKTASSKEITSAYRKLAKKHHPDANPGEEETFKEISAAYDVLGDPDRRKEYDEVRAMGPAAGMGGFPGGFGGGGTTFRVEDVGDFSDLFGGLFGRGRRGAATGPQRGADVETELHLSFEDAVNGVTTSVNTTTDARCHTCHGSGAAPGTKPTTCPRCGGSGTLQDDQGLFSLSQICPQCGGRGTVVTTPCPTCAGTGVEHRNRSVKVRIPAGVEDGQRIRVKGRGAAGRGNGSSGDLYVVVRVGKHSVFGRRGRNLTLTVPISYPEATLGTTLTVPTLTDSVTLRVPPGTPSGRTFRVRGRGVPGGRKATGDLLVTVDVAVPESLTDEQRTVVEELAKLIEPPAATLDLTGGLEMSDDRRSRAVYVISVAAELTGVHPQTLRVYERKGLLDPIRTSGGSRRFSDEDLERLRHIQSLTNAGLNLEGVRRVMEFEAEVARLRKELAATRAEAKEAVALAHAKYRRELVPLKQFPVPVRPARRAAPRTRRSPMSLNPDRWTLKTQEALSSAVERARAQHNPEVTPEHVLAAILDQTDGIAGPILTRVGVEPGAVRTRIGAELERLSQAVGGAEPGINRALRDVLAEADSIRTEMGDDYLSVEHLLLAMADRVGVEPRPAARPRCGTCGGATG